MKIAERGKPLKRLEGGGLDHDAANSADGYLWRIPAKEGGTQVLGLFRQAGRSKLPPPAHKGYRASREQPNTFRQTHIHDWMPWRANGVLVAYQCADRQCHLQRGLDNIGYRWPVEGEE